MARREAKTGCASGDMAGGAGLAVAREVAPDAWRLPPVGRHRDPRHGSS
jgi:hypothetical protein